MTAPMSAACRLYKTRKFTSISKYTVQMAHIFFRVEEEEQFTLTL